MSKTVIVSGSKKKTTVRVADVGNAGPAGGPGTPGAENRGSGGGGGSYSQPSPALSGNGGSGGKGVVIIRYNGSVAAGGGEVTTSPGYTIHTFTGDGTFSTNANFGGANTFSIN